MAYMWTYYFLKLALFSWVMREQENISLVDQYVIDLVRELRDKKELTQQGLADAIGLSRSFIRSVESPNSRAKYNVRHINALADYFGMSPKDFLPQKPFPVDAPVEKSVKKNAPVKKAPAKKATVKKVAKKSNK